MKTRLCSNSTLYGHLTIQVYAVKNGRRRRILRMSNKNLVTNLGREAVLALLAQDAAGTVLQANPAYNQIWALAVGSDSTPPSILDTSLYTEEGRYQLTVPAEREYVIVPPNIFEIHVHKEIAAGTLTGITVAEAGLYTRGDNDNPALAANQILYARQIHPAFTKGATMAVEYEWKLGMLVQLP